MTRYVFYHGQTGALHREVKHLDGTMVSINTPAEHIPLAHATAHPLHHRVDVTTGTITRLPAPTPDHEWKGDRWVLNENAMRRQRERREARLEITNLEHAQMRPLREAALGDSKALERLRAIEQRIIDLRKLL